MACVSVNVKINETIFYSFFTLYSLIIEFKYFYFSSDILFFFVFSLQHNTSDILSFNTIEIRLQTPPNPPRIINIIHRIHISEDVSVSAKKIDNAFAYVVFISNIVEKVSFTTYIRIRKLHTKFKIWSENTSWFYIHMNITDKTIISNVLQTTFILVR